ISIFTTNFQVMLFGRLLQGLGVAGPRTVTVALIRDLYEGRTMARVMSFVMGVFILIPIVAPALGQGIILVTHWRAIFIVYLILTLIMLGWFAIRQAETLLPDQRIPFQTKVIIEAAREVFTNRISLGYMLVMGFISGPFIGFLSSAQLIFQDQYNVGTLFPFYFALLGVASGIAFFLNSQLVMRYGMRLLSNQSTVALCLISVSFFVIAAIMAGNPPLWATVVYFMVTFFMVGILFGNLNALAMEPLGHIAGVGAAVIGSLSNLMAVPLGAVIGMSYNRSVLPLVGGFALFSLISLGIMYWVEQGEERRDLSPGLSEE
ncbi:MAG: MFS transporter, partial [Chloroflexota bacterium]